MSFSSPASFILNLVLMPYGIGVERYICSKIIHFQRERRKKMFRDNFFLNLFPKRGKQQEVRNGPNVFFFLVSNYFDDFLCSLYESLYGSHRSQDETNIQKFVYNPYEISCLHFYYNGNGEEVVCFNCGLKHIVYYFV